MPGYKRKQVVSYKYGKANNKTKRRRIVVGNRFRKTRRFTMYGSNNQPSSVTGYRARRWTPRDSRIARNRAWISSSSQEKYRSLMATSFLWNTPQSYQYGNYHFINPTANNKWFWTTSGGLELTREVSAPTFGDTLYVRGGVTKVTLSLPEDANSGVTIIMWRIKMLGRMTIPSTQESGSAYCGWDPSFYKYDATQADQDKDWWLLYRFWGRKEITLLPGHSTEIDYRWKSGNVHASMYKAGQGMDKMCMFYTSLTNGNTAITGQLSHNLTFTADRLT